MPFPFFHRCHAASQPTESMSNDEPGRLQDWKVVRRQHLRNMRKQVRTVVLCMAALEVFRHGPVELAYLGKPGHPQPGPEDYGIAYNVGYFLNWLYVCLFTVIFVPLFSWWVPSLSSDPNSTFSVINDKMNTFLTSYLIPLVIGITLVEYLFYAVSCFIYVEAKHENSKKWPTNTKKIWLVRGLLLMGIVISTSSGYGIFNLLGRMDLAHVKDIEYRIIVLPFQVNFGMFLGTIMQFRMEKCQARRAAKAQQNAAEAQLEKRELIDV